MTHEQTRTTREVTIFKNFIRVSYILCIVIPPFLNVFAYSSSLCLANASHLWQKVPLLMFLYSTKQIMIFSISFCHHSLLCSSSYISLPFPLYSQVPSILISSVYMCFHLYLNINFMYEINMSNLALWIWYFLLNMMITG